jgi:hypothetical protein
MIIAVLDPWLAALLASAVLLAQLWPAAAEDVMVLLDELRLAGTTLADALQNGLVRVLEPVPGTADPHLSVACGQAVLSGLARSRDGELVRDPHLRPSEVCHLAVANLVVGGVSALSRAAV